MWTLSLTNLVHTQSTIMIVVFLLTNNKCQTSNSIVLKFTDLCRRKDAQVNMEGQFLVRQIYDDEVTYNIIGAAVKRLSEYNFELKV